MCEDGSCEIDHDLEDVYLDATIGYFDVVAEFVENMEGFQYES